MTRHHLLLASAVLALTAVSFFHFPGHTILYQDTQIYLPILERLWNPNVLANDPMASRPHVTFTVYDEALFLLRRITGLGFEPLLLAQQFVYRAVGVFGLYLLGVALGLGGVRAFLLAGVASLGATIAGPMVLTVEYEPVPRAFAMPFLLLCLGLLAHERWVSASVAAGVAFVFHPPTAVGLCALLLIYGVWKRNTHAVLPLVLAILLFGALVTIPHRAPDGQEVFARIDPALEQIQRTRANYNWVSIWVEVWIWQYIALAAFGGIALWRLARVLPNVLKFCFAGLIAGGLLSIPISYLLLEQTKWIVAPQFQPARYLVFVTFLAVVLGTAAGLRAAEKRRWWEALLFLVVPFAVPVQAKLSATLVDWRKMALVLVLAGLTIVAVRLRGTLRAITAAAVLAVAFFGVPAVGVANYPELHTEELDQLAAWARSSTRAQSVFFFPAAGRGLEPGIFRARALRPVYVDWKAGGQVNFIRAYAAIWWERWNKARRAKTAAEYRRLGIDYVVVPAGARLDGAEVVFANAAYTVLALSPATLP